MAKAPSDGTQKLITQAFADSDAADTSDTAETTAEGELSQAQSSLDSAKKDNLEKHQTALASAHAAIQSLLNDLKTTDVVVPK